MLIEHGAAHSHDPISDRHSPWVLARRLGETAIHEALTNYLDPALNDDVPEDRWAGLRTRDDMRDEANTGRPNVSRWA